MSDNDTAVQEDVQQNAPADSAPVESSSEVVEESNVQRDDGELIPQETESNSDLKADDTASESDAEETEAAPRGDIQTDPKTDWDNLKGSSQDRFRQTVNERNYYKRQLEDLKAREAQFAQEQDLLNEINPETGDYYTPQEAERIAHSQARKQQAETIAIERYQLEVQQNQSVIQSEAQKALQDFPMFDEANPKYNKNLAAKADRLLAQSLIFDEYGTLVGSAISPYEIYQTVYDSNQANSAQYRAEAQRSTEKMLANADNPGSAKQGAKSFDKMSLSEKEAYLRSKGHDV